MTVKIYNSQNEIIKRKYAIMLRNAKGREEKTINGTMQAIYEFETLTGFEDFKKFNIQQAIQFKEHLAKKENKVTGYPISKSYLRNHTTHVRRFFEWLHNQKGYKKYIEYDDTQYFNLTRNDRNRASATGYQEGYLIEDILSTIRAMPQNTELEKRNKALISLCLLTTPRISALRTARIESLKYYREYDSWAFFQNSNLVDTKYAKHITSYFIGDSQDIYENVISWQSYLIKKGFTGRDPLFPKIVPNFNTEGMQIQDLKNELLKSNAPIRTIFKKALNNNGITFNKVHTFRHTLVRAALMKENSPSLISALDQNMGHSMNTGTILSSYGTTPEHERAKVLKSFKLE